MDPSPFPLLKLPYVVLNEVISTFKQREILDFSFISKKCNSIIKTSNLFQYEIRINLKENLPTVGFTFPEVSIFDICIIPTDYFEEREIHMKKVVDMNKYSEDLDEKNVQLSIIWADYICDLYRVNKVAGIYLNADAPVNKTSLIVEWLNRRITYSINLHLSGTKTNEDGLEWFFDRLRVSIRSLSLRLDDIKELRPLNLKLNNLDHFEARGKDFTSPIKWITVDHILSSNCKSIFMTKTAFTEMDFNRFIKSWLNGNHSRLEMFCADVKQMNRDSVIDGVEVEERDINVKRVFTAESPMTYNYWYELNGGYDIYRSGGTSATIKLDYLVSEFQPPRYRFLMVVWPKLA